MAAELDDELLESFEGLVLDNGKLHYDRELDGSVDDQRTEPGLDYQPQITEDDFTVRAHLDFETEGNLVLIDGKIILDGKPDIGDFSYGESSWSYSLERNYLEVVWLGETGDIDGALEEVPELASLYQQAALNEYQSKGRIAVSAE